jgi:predicted Fe-S protein YdhL (DUF1289 family)
MTEPVASPCVRICCLDDNDVCLGCGRTLDEIRRWSEMSEAQKRATVEQAAERRAARLRRFQDAVRS